MFDADKNDPVENENWLYRREELLYEWAEYSRGIALFCPNGEKQASSSWSR